MEKETTAAALRVLAKKYSIPLSEAALSLSEQLQFPEPGRNAYAAMCLLLPDAAAAARWMQWFTDHASPKQDFDTVLSLAESFLEEEKDGGKKKRIHLSAVRDALFHRSPYALAEQLSKAVRKGNPASIVEALKQLPGRAAFTGAMRVSIRAARDAMIGTITALSRAAIQGGANAETAFALSNRLIQQVEQQGTGEDVLAMEDNVLMQFAELMKGKLQKTYSPPIAKVMHYIENNLDQKVRLDSAAAYAKVHPVYLSARFKKETGTAFSAYVMQRKIHESTYFVRHTDYTFGQIAALYGFSNQSYYISSFKRILGMTPTEYRAKYTAE